jgi:hypothetical protein
VSTTTSSGKLIVSVYFLRNGKIAAARRVVPPTQAVGRAALSALMKGPTDSEVAAGLKTAVPKERLFSLDIINGVARVRHVETWNEFGLAQVTYTLTQFPTVRAVRVNQLDATTRKLTRKRFERYTPAILVESPVVGESVSSRIRLLGTANTFEATFQVELRAGGHRLARKTVTATSGSGTRGTFDASLRFRVRRPMAGVLLAYEVLAATGRPTHVVRIPLRLEPD